MNIDIELAIQQLGLSHCMYKVSKEDPNKLSAWYGPDPEPSQEAIEAAWAEYQSAVNVPDSIDMRRARLALRAAGHLAAVNAAIEAMEGDASEDARIEWEYATTIKRDHPLVAAMQQALDLTDQQLDDLFLAASQLQ